MASKDWALNMEPKIMYNTALRGRKLISREASLENKANIIVRQSSQISGHPAKFGAVATIVAHLSLCPRARTVVPV